MKRILFYLMCALCCVPIYAHPQARIAVAPSIAKTIGTITASGTTDEGVAYIDVTLTEAGTLQNTVDLGTLTLTDSLVVRGPVDADDFKVMKQSAIPVINIENASVKDNTIPDEAFLSDKHLTRIILPDNIVTFGASAFNSCKNLKHINFPASLREIGKEALSLCTSLHFTKLVFSEELVQIGEGAFQYCYDLADEVVLPASIKSIMSNAFVCTNISEINFPNSLEYIGSYAFRDTKLKKVLLPPNVKVDSSYGTFMENAELRSIQLPDIMSVIPYCFLEKCTSLVYIKIPESVKSIDDWAFRDCSSLFQVDFNEGLEKIGDEAFSGCGLTTLKLPEGVKTIGKRAFFGLHNLEEANFPYSLQTLGEQSCMGWIGVKAIYCEAPTPPECLPINSYSECPFGFYEDSQLNTWDRTPVYVPMGTAERYRNAHGWNYFTNFKEKEYSGVEAVEGEEQSIPEYFNLQGMPVANPSDGIYIVKRGNKITKEYIR